MNNITKLQLLIKQFSNNASKINSRKSESTNINLLKAAASAIFSTPDLLPSLHWSVFVAKSADLK